MALTLTPVYKGKFSDRRLHLYTVVFDSSYAAGGEAITANEIGLTSIDTIVVFPSTAGRVGVFDSANSKLLAMATGSSATAALSESTAGTDLSTFSATMLAIGT